MNDPALAYNCPHIGKDGWGCGAAAGEPCNWSHDDVAPDEYPPTFHAERQLQASGGNTEIPRDILDRAVDDLVG